MCVNAQHNAKFRSNNRELDCTV